jgi:hypothetical protein
VSFNTWTPHAVASNSQPLKCAAWRAVEAQHIVSTLALVDSLEEQEILEFLLERSKPRVPPEASHLHYLLATPFRYPPSAHGSRFRAPHQPGVFYGADETRTACAELGHWRWRFLLDSPALASIGSKPQTVFQTLIATSTSVDVRVAPFDADTATWTHPTDYSGCQAFANVVHAANVHAIQYESVRDPQQGRCIALLTPGGFAESKPLDLQTWSLTVTRTHVVWQRQSAITPAAFEFSFTE